MIGRGPAVSRTQGCVTGTAPCVTQSGFVSFHPATDKELDDSSSAISRLQNVIMHVIGLLPPRFEHQVRVLGIPPFATLKRWF